MRNLAARDQLSADGSGDTGHFCCCARAPGILIGMTGSKNMASRSTFMLAQHFHIEQKSPFAIIDGRLLEDEGAEKLFWIDLSISKFNGLIASNTIIGKDTQSLH